MNLLLVDDDLDYADGLGTELRSLDHDVTLAHSAREALLAIDRDRFDAVILDRMMPVKDGTEMLRDLRARGQGVPVLMLSALGQSPDKVSGLEAGADDYIVKPTPAPEIDARLKALVRARGWTESAGDTLKCGDIVVSPGQHRAWRAGEPLDLGRLELRLLAELARHQGSFLTRAMLLERVWGYDFEPATNIVDAQIRALRRKLTANGGSDPIVTKRGVGYMLDG